MTAHRIYSKASRCFSFTNLQTNPSGESGEDLIDIPWVERTVEKEFVNRCPQHFEIAK